MSGAVKNIVNTPKNILKSPGRSLTAIATAGGSELARLNPAINAAGNMVDNVQDRTLRPMWGVDNRGNNQNLSVSGQDPAELLAQTGGAPLLANIAMGVDPQDALAGYFGKNTKDGSWNEFLQGLSQKDFDAINSVHGQINTIANDRTLRQKAVDSVIADFPNLATNAAKARQQAGGEFDEMTKGAMSQALGDAAAKYNFGGNLSSGAANEAFARVGNENVMKKLDYMGGREANQYQMDSQVLNSRLGEVNALRDFQNTMLTGQVGQGFSAQQANLQRQFQGQQMNVQMKMQQDQNDQAGKNAMFGALGTLGGTALGAAFMGPMGASIGGSLFGSPSPKINTPKFGGGGYGSGPGIDTSGYAPGNQYRGY